MNYYEEFQKCVDTLINISNKRREQFFHIEDTIGTIEFIKEFCQVHVNIGRRSGKTEYINRNATDSDLVITASVIMMQLYKGKNCFCHGLERGIEDSANKKFERIYIDEPYLHRVNISEYFKFGNSRSTFILLGE